MNIRNKKRRLDWYILGRLFSLLLCFSVICVFSSISSVSISAEDNAEKIDTTRAALEQWVELQRVISKEKSELALAKEMLQERINLVQREIDSQRSKIKDAEASIAEADQKRTEMIDENEKLKQASASLTETLVNLEESTKGLIKKIPEPIQTRIKPLSQRLPEDGVESKLSISERFQNVVGILNEVDKFNRDISVNSEVHKLPNGTSAEVTALYLGIGQSYYVGSNGSVGGVGWGADDGWRWQPADDAASQINLAIAIMKNEQPASFVLLPIEIHE